MRSPRVITAVLAGIVLITAAGCSSPAQDSANSLAAALQSAAAEASRAAEAAASMTVDLPAVGDSVEASTSSAAVPEPVTRQIDKTGWYEGFAITVNSVTAEQQYSDYADVTIDFTYENLGSEQSRAPEATVVVDGAVQEGYADTPGVPGGGKAAGTLTVTVQGKTSTDAATPIMDLDKTLDSVTLQYGNAKDNQTVIPLAADGKVDSIEPKTLDATGTMTQGQIIVEIVGGTLVPSYESGEKGKSLVNLQVKLTCAAGCSGSGYAIGRGDFSLTAPDGTSITADDRSLYCCDALYPETVSDSARNILTFVVKAPGSGKYQLAINHQYADAPKATFDFTA